MISKTYSVTGQDNVVIAGFPLTDFADGDNYAIAFPNDDMVVKKGKNGNAIFASNSQGTIGEVTMRLIRGSTDDKTMNSLQAQQLQDPAAFPLMNGVFQKRAGDGNGFVTNDSYLQNGGVFKKHVDAKSSAEGDTDQAVSVYTLTFADVQRGIL